MRVDEVGFVGNVNKPGIKPCNIDLLDEQNMA